MRTTPAVVPPCLRGCQHATERDHDLSDPVMGSHLCEVHLGNIRAPHEHQTYWRTVDVLLTRVVEPSGRVSGGPSVELYCWGDEYRGGLPVAVLPKLAELFARAHAIVAGAAVDARVGVDT